MECLLCTGIKAGASGAVPKNPDSISPINTSEILSSKQDLIVAASIVFAVFYFIK